MGTMFKLVAGLAVLALAGTYLGWYGWQVRSNSPVFTSMTANKRCEHPLHEVRIEPTVLTEDGSATLQVYLRQEGNPRFWPPGYQREAEARARIGPCEARVRLLAPSFDYEPDEAEQVVTLPATLDQRRLVWVIAPKRRGNHRLVVSSGLDAWEVRVTVMTSMGVIAAHAAWGSLIIGLLAGAYSLTQIVEVLRRSGSRSASR